MDRQEVIEKYSEITLDFDYYYKYSFHFKGRTPEGYFIEAVYGGTSDQIYRFDFDGSPERLADPETWSMISIRDIEGDILYNYESSDWY